MMLVSRNSYLSACNNKDDSPVYFRTLSNQMSAKNLCIHQLYYKISYFSFGKKRRTISRPPVFGSLFLVGTHQLLRINFFLYFIISNSRNFNNPFLQIFLFNYTVVFTPLIVACSSSPIGITRHFCPLITCDLICDAFSGFTRSTTSYVFVSAI